MGGVGNQIFAPAAFHLSGRFCKYGLEMLRISAFKYSKVIAGIVDILIRWNASICSRKIANNRLKIPVIHAPDLHSLKSSFWPQKCRFTANIHLSFSTFSLHIKQLAWSDHRLLHRLPSPTSFHSGCGCRSIPGCHFHE